LCIRSVTNALLQLHQLKHNLKKTRLSLSPCGRGWLAAPDA
jgi:hypothetical protein